MNNQAGQLSRDSGRGTVVDWREFGDAGLAGPLKAALELFSEQGYHGSSVREIANRAGLSVPGLYHYYPSKQALLQALLDAAMSDLLERSDSAEASAGADPVARFDAVVELLLRFHMYRRELAFVASTEIRSLDPDYRVGYIARRDQQQRTLDRIVQDGRDSGDFAIEYPLDASRAITTMCVAVSTWYRPNGALGPDELVRRYLSVARQAVGYHG